MNSNANNTADGSIIYDHSHGFTFEEYLLNRADVIDAMQNGIDVEVRFKVEPTIPTPGFAPPVPLWKGRLTPERFYQMKLSTCKHGDLVLYVEDDNGNPWPLTAYEEALHNLTWMTRRMDGKHWDDNSFPLYSRVHPFFEIGAPIAMPIHSSCECAYCTFVQSNRDEILMANVNDSQAFDTPTELLGALVKTADAIMSHPLFDSQDSGSVEHLDKVMNWVEKQQTHISNC